MRISFVSLLLCTGMVLMAASAEQQSLQVETERPGNLFAHGAPAVLQIRGRAQMTVEWSARDYRGEVAAAGRVELNGNGQGQVRIRELARGYYELECEGDDESARVAFGVISDHSQSAPRSGRINVDGATAWLEHQGRYEELARILRAAGIGWVRERFSWGATEPQRGQITYDSGDRHYDTVAEAYDEQGVRVYQIWHDTPGWTHPDDKNTRNPRDLRDVYRFAKRVAVHYDGSVAAWEVWNEPDIGFWPDLCDTFAGVQKAAYLGYKAADADLPVLLASLCRGYCPFAEALFESGIEDYFDIFNWHVYAKPSRYDDKLDRYLDMLERHDCADRPVWLTEAGIRLEATEAGGELNDESERRQAEFVPASFACSLAAGTDRHFFFVYPYYLERGIQFGSLRKALSPRPCFIAIAAAVDILGDAEYLGDYPLEGEDTYAKCFDNGEETVIVVWADGEREVQIPVGAEQITVADLLGRRSELGTAGGQLTLKVSSSGQYIIGADREIREHLEGEVRPAGQMPQTAPHPLVVRGWPETERVNKQADAHIVQPNEVEYKVEVCNLSETEKQAGRIWLELPEGWRATPAEFEAELEPMGRIVESVRLRGMQADIDILKVWVYGEFNGDRIAPSVSRFQFDLAAAEPGARLDLKLNGEQRWAKNIAGIGTMEIEVVAERGVRFDARFHGPGDRWCYPIAHFDTPLDLSEFDGIAFEYRTEADPDMSVHLQVIERGGSAYLSSGMDAALGKWERAVCVFDDLRWGSFSQPDANDKLDTDSIARLMIGLNTEKDRAVLEVRDVEAVKFR